VLHAVSAASETSSMQWELSGAQDRCACVLFVVACCVGRVYMSFCHVSCVVAIAVVRPLFSGSKLSRRASLVGTCDTETVGALPYHIQCCENCKCDFSAAQLEAWTWSKPAFNVEATVK